MFPPGLRNIEANVMDDARSNTQRYRDTAQEIRQLARRAHSAEIRTELLGLAEQFERLAERAQLQRANLP